jgi:integrase/recombinase XerD
LYFSTVLLTHKQKEEIMKVSQVANLWLNYHRANSSKNTIRAYKELMERFCQENGEKDLKELTSDDVLDFLNGITEGKKSQTRKTRFSHLTSFFNFTRNNIDQTFQNPCDSPIIKKTFRAKALAAWDILEKEIVDEIIFKTDNPRDRLMLELMARGGMRIGEVLKLTPRDVYGRKLIIRDPKSGKEKEFIFIPQKIADRLKDYIRENGPQPEDRIFPICYETSRSMAKKAGDVVGIHLRPHDLRRHAATFASRSGVPLEIVSKIILRHANLSTTQRYLGKISDVEAIRWIENIHG